MATFRAAQIVLADWRDALPKEPNKRRPAIVVEDSDLFDAAYPNVILVPLTADNRLAIADLTVIIDPTPENGCKTRSYALAHCVATTSAAWLTATKSQVTIAQLHEIRQKIAISIGL